MNEDHYGLSKLYGVETGHSLLFLFAEKSLY